MEIKVKISGLEELVDDITKAKVLINELIRKLSEISPDTIADKVIRRKTK